MKSSRFYFMVFAGVIALVTGGAAGGSYFPNLTLYSIIAAAAVGAIILIVFGFTGHEVEKREVVITKKPKNKKEKKVAEDDSFEDISSGR